MRTGHPRDRSNRKRQPSTQQVGLPSAQARIRPIVMYPFVQPLKLESLELLFRTLDTWSSDPEFHKPVVVINNQTRYRSTTMPIVEDPRVDPAYKQTISKIIRPVATILPSWAVDSCAMWLSGLGHCFDAATESRSYNDVFFLLPGHFDFSSEEGKVALGKLREIPEKVLNHECGICLGEIEVPLNSAKQLIDTYGTYGLLYNWFPAEAKGIRRRTDKPRTEFFALSYDSLKHSLIPHRWYAYE